MKQLLTASWQTWLRALIGGFIGGAASAGCAWLGLTGAQSLGMNVPKLNLEGLGVVLLTGGITHTLTYLAKSPLPDFTPTPNEQPPADKPEQTKP